MKEADKIKPSFNTERASLGEVLPIDTPFSIILDPSDHCNLTCSYCFRAGDNPEKPDEMAWGSKKKMPWETFMKIVEQIGDFPSPVKKIALSGHGEPLANRRLPDMVREIKKRYSSVVEIHTNATLLNPAYVADLVDSRIDKIIVSLQGLTPEAYKDVAEYKLDYENFYSNLKLLYQTKHNTELNIKIADVALKEGEQQVFIDTFSPIADKVYIESTVPLWERVVFIGKKGSGKVGVNKFGEDSSYVNCCSIMFYTMLITPIGTIYPCTQALMSYDIGNIHSATLVECWNGERRKNLLRTHLTDGRHKISDCKTCYVVQNSILTPSDMIDDYSDEILARLEENE